MGLSERLRKLIGIIVPATRRFAMLEEQTHVKAETWRTWWNRGGKASAEMIQGVGQAWPEYAFWLVTGTSDVGHGHRSPDDEEVIARIDGPYLHRTAARDLFLKQIERNRWCEENSWTIGQDDDDDGYNSSIGEYTDQRAKQFSKLSSDAWVLTIVRNEQEKTFEKIKQSQPDESKSTSAKNSGFETGNR